MIGVDGAIPPTGRVTPPLRLVLLAGVLTTTAICTDPAPVAVQEDYDYGANLNFVPGPAERALRASGRQRLRGPLGRSPV